MTPKTIVAPQAILLAALLGASCAGPQQPAPVPPKAPQASRPAAALPAPQSEIRGELLGSLVVSSLDSLLGRLSGYLAPALPGPLQPVVQPEALKAQLYKKLHLDSLGPALDDGRPIAVAMADPLAYSKGLLGSMVVALPLRDASAFLDGLARLATRHESTPWKDRVFDFNGRLLLCRVEQSWAFLASHEKLLHGARAALLPLLGGSAPGGLQVTVDTNAIQTRYAAQIDAAVAAASGLLKGRGPEIVRRWVGYLKGTRSIELALALQPERLHALVSARAQGSGEFRKYLDALPTGEPWGARYLPADSALVLLDRSRPEDTVGWLDDLLQTGKPILGQAFDEASLKQLRDAVAASLGEFGAESAVGLWATSDGGVGFGGVNTVKDGAAARKQVAKSIKIVAAELLKKVNAPGKPRFSLAVRPLQVAGLKADLFEVSVAWPRPKDKEARAKLEQTRRTLEKLVGPRLRFAFVATGGVGLFAVGKDCQKRLAEMAAVAKGGQGSNLEKICRGLAAGRRVAVLAYSPLVSVVEGAMRVADQLTGVPQDLRDTVNKLLPGPGRNIPATVMLYKEDDRLLWQLDLSSDLVGALAKFILRGSAPAAVP